MSGRQARLAVRRFGAGIIRHFPLLVLGLSITVNVLLASRLLRAQQPTAPKLNVGAMAQPFVGQSVDGNVVRVDYQSAMPTILYYFSPSCGWCERNWANVRALTQQTRGRFRFVGISTTAVSAEFLRERHLDFEVAANLSPAVASSYGLGGTPQTILVSADAQVLQNWVGAYVGTQARDVESYFGLRLPGLVSRPVAPRP
jgi:peroxiredoxin